MKQPIAAVLTRDDITEEVRHRWRWTYLGRLSVASVHLDPSERSYADQFLDALQALHGAEVTVGVIEKNYKQASYVLRSTALNVAAIARGYGGSGTANQASFVRRSPGTLE